jgi:hypothetical protein
VSSRGFAAFATIVFSVGALVNGVTLVLGILLQQAGFRTISPLAKDATQCALNGRRAVTQPATAGTLNGAIRRILRFLTPVKGSCFGNFCPVGERFAPAAHPLRSAGQIFTPSMNSRRIQSTPSA